MTGYLTRNPATGEIERTWPSPDDEQVEASLAAARRAYSAWRETPVARRADILAGAGRLLTDRAEELARIAATEMGKPLRQGIGEVTLCGQIFSYYAEHAEELTADDRLSASGALSSVVEKRPLGVLLGVMPWNYPYYQLARFAAPALLMGNAVMVKPASICAASASRLAEVLVEAGLPADLFQTLLVGSDRIEQIIADPRIRGVSLTGSEGAGAAVAAAAGRHLKKVVLELGGSDPLLVLGGDIPATARSAARARLGNAGQACNSPKRMIVLDRHYEQFLDELVSQVSSARVGDPVDPDTAVGPMSSDEARSTVLDLVEDAVEQGAELHTGGAAVAGPGYYMQPTVLTGVTPRMRAYSEELFGPVAVVYRVADVDAAVDLANDTDFGLSGSVWTDDLELAAATARRLEVGMAYVNEHGTTRADLPFGGIGRSGFGRELGRYGVEEFINRRLVRIAGPARSGR